MNQTIPAAGNRLAKESNASDFQRNAETPFFDWRDAFLKAAIAWGGLVVLISEGLSLFKALNRTTIPLSWAVIFLVFVYWGWRKGFYKTHFRVPIRRVFLRQFQNIDGFFLLVPILFFVILVVIAWIAPPNTNDSLSYHMSRVMHWIQDHGLQHYSTPIPRQISMPTWAETAILQFQVLTGNDRLANFIQWFSALASLVGVSLIAKNLGAGFVGQVISAIFCATIPMGILQATSTQNDFVNSFWVVCLVYFASLGSQRRLSGAEWVWLCMAVGAGVLTKGTYYAFALPFLGWLFVSVLRREGWISAAKGALLVIFVVFLFNVGVWARNFQTYGFPLGPVPYVRSLSNQSHTPAAILSNVIRNTALQVTTPLGPVNNVMLKAIQWVHGKMKQDLNDPATTLKANQFRLKYSIHEDYAGNPVHFPLVFLGSLVLVLFKDKRKRSSGILFSALVLSTFILFSALYKWQPFSTRLQLPFLVIAAPIVGLGTGQPNWVVLRIVLVAVLAIHGLIYLLFNPSKPILSQGPGVPTLFNTPRNVLLFINSSQIRRGYGSVTQAVKVTGCRSVGLKIDSSDREYPFWVLLSPSGEEVRLEHLDVSPPLDRYAPADFVPCAIICTICGGDRLGNFQRASEHPGGITLFLPAKSVP